MTMTEIPQIMVPHDERVMAANMRNDALMYEMTDTNGNNGRASTESYHNSSYSTEVVSCYSNRLAVDVDNVGVSYGYGRKTTQILKGINLTVPEGTIYGLLGPSGCGKTTLLRCIVGQKSVRNGSVTVFGQVPGTDGACIPGPGVGYMPQELTLYPEFTIAETLTYFGRLFRMAPDTLKDRIAFLMKFLDLPSKHRLVKNLSGGQQRRVSLAAALIHKPPLLILDEPTVGVDPLLRKAIWNYLVTLTREDNMTIIVTTHYIEEARQANIVGLMRSGRILAEDDPAKLLKEHQCPSLEDVFLKLCIADSEQRSASVKQLANGNPGVQSPQPETKSALRESPIRYAMPVKASRTSFNYTPHNSFADFCVRTYVLAIKNLIRIGRNLPILLFTFLVPSFQIVLFCMCIGGDPVDLPMAIVNYDRTPVKSEQFLEKLSPKTIIQRPFESLDEALDSVRRGETWGVIHIGDSFSRSLEYRFILGLDVDNQTLDDSTIDVHLDMTNQQIGFILQQSIISTFKTFCEELLTSMGKSTRLAELPIRIKDPIFGEAQPNFTEFMAPGIILSITYFMAVGLTATSITMESREGTMERSSVAGVRPFEVIISHVISQFSVMVVQVALLLGFTFLVFKVPVTGSFFLVLVMTLLQGLTGMTFGLVISSICQEEQSAMMLSLGTFYPNLLLSGIIWPVQAVPGIVRYISYGLPQTIPAESLRCIMYRGWDMSYTEVWSGFAISGVWTLFFLAFATIAFKARS